MEEFRYVGSSREFHVPPARDVLGSHRATVASHDHVAVLPTVRALSVRVEAGIGMLLPDAIRATPLGPVSERRGRRTVTQ